MPWALFRVQLLTVHIASTCGAAVVAFTIFSLHGFCFETACGCDSQASTRRVTVLQHV